MERVDVERDTSAAPEVVWQLVSDLRRMGEWSPENTGGEWVKGATGPAAGAFSRQSMEPTLAGVAAAAESTSP